MSNCSASLSVVQMLYFFPRGGSAQVIRYLTSALTKHDAHCRILSGSLGQPGDATHAETFFANLDVTSMDYAPAVRAWEQGRDPLLEPVPMHASYEDRNGGADPDPIFTSVTPETGSCLESRWADLLQSSLPELPDLFHIHHLSPLQAAVRANWSNVPVIGHIHGTELKMLDGIDERRAILRKLGLSLCSDPDDITAAIQRDWDSLDAEEQVIAASTRWVSWQHGDHWRLRLKDYAAMCDRLIVLTDEAGERAAEQFDYDPLLIHPVPNGVDINLFSPVRQSAEDRLSRWRHWLVDEPRGWDESSEPGTVRYSQQEVDDWFIDASGEPTPVLFFVGRFMSMKRVPLLIRAYKRAQPGFKWRAPLVIWGGNPGEWEDEHPVTVAREEDVPGVFFVGWRGHEELPDGLNAADVMVAPSKNEPFGQVYLEAMACQIPVIATLSGGPPSFINQRPDALDGWLVPPDDEAALAAALVNAVNDPGERRRRGQNAIESVRSAYSWTQVAGTVREIYDDVLANR